MPDSEEAAGAGAEAAEPQVDEVRPIRSQRVPSISKSEHQEIVAKLDAALKDEQKKSKQLQKDKKNVSPTLTVTR